MTEHKRKREKKKLPTQNKLQSNIMNHVEKKKQLTIKMFVILTFTQQ